MEDGSKKGYKCPVCGQHTFDCPDEFDVCPVCGWEDDYYQIMFPDEDNCANEMSLNEARQAWQEGKKVR